MKKEEFKKVEFELIPKFDNCRSFYRKAKIKKIEKGGKSIILLYSYDVPVLAIQENNDYNYYYLNTKIEKNLLYSQTTLRHIKEALKQFYFNKEYTKKEIEEKAIKINFDFLLYHNANYGNEIKITNYKEYYRATSPDTTKAFKKLFDNYRERRTQDNNGMYMFTSCQNGYSNYYYYYIKEV